jgi:hypothetical protein
MGCAVLTLKGSYHVEDTITRENIMKHLKIVQQYCKTRNNVISSLKELMIMLNRYLHTDSLD